MKQLKSIRILLVLGGMAFGFYFCYGLSFFETFGPSNAVSLRFFTPIFAFLSLIFGALALALYGRMFSNRIPFVQVWAPILAFILAGTGIFAYAAPQLPLGFSWELFGDIAQHLCLIGLLPTIAALILIPTGEEIGSQILGDDEGRSSKTELLVFPAYSNQQAFEIRQKDLISVEAADNYCKFTFVQNGQAKSKTLRMKMKEVEEALEKNPSFQRCHRSYLVNIDFFEEIMGSSQAYRIKLKQLEDTIPVSRSFNIDLLRPRAQ